MQLKKTLAAATAAVAFASAAQAAVIINEVYPGGGGAAATNAFTRDYVELYNTGPGTVDLTGFRVTYASTGGNFGTNNVVAFGAGSFIAPNDFLLLVTGGAGTGGAPVPAANFFNGTTSGASLSGTAGSVALVDAANVQVDVVGYGALTTTVDANGVAKTEGTAAPAPTNNATSLNRVAFADSGNNSVDFVNAAPTPTVGVASAVVVPEPATLGLLGGAVALVGLRRRAK